jgi:hypothetical protein
VSFTEFLVGKREQISWGAESTYGSGVTPTEVVGINARIEPSFNQNWQKVLSAGTDARTVENEVLGPLSLPFTLTFANVNWKFLKYCGYGVTNAGSPGAYTHTFAIANTVASFTLEWARRATTSRVTTLTGCVVKKMKIAFKKSSGEGTGSLIAVTLECVAQNYSTGTAVTSLSAITDSPYQFRMSKLTLVSNEIVEVNSGEYNIDNGINEDNHRYCNSTLDRKIGEPVPLVHIINGNFNINIKDATLFGYWAAGVALTGTNTLLFYRGSNDQLLITFTGIRMAQCNEPTQLEGVTNSDVVWMALSNAIVATDATQTY